MITEHVKVYKSSTSRSLVSYAIELMSRTAVDMADYGPFSAGVHRHYGSYSKACSVARKMHEACVERELRDMNLDPQQINEDKPMSKSNKLRNLAAFVSEDLVSVGVVLTNGQGIRSKEYTYLATQELADQLRCGETQVVVFAAGRYTIGEVARVDDEVDIDIDAPHGYQPITCIVDNSHEVHIKDELDAKEAELKKQQRKVLRQQVLAQLDQKLLEDVSVE